MKKLIVDFFVWLATRVLILATRIGERAVGQMPPGVHIHRNIRGRHIVFDPGLAAEHFTDFLDVMIRNSTEFSLFDPEYPSPSDPGAYLSYSPQKGALLMTLGNHGWSGGIYTMSPEIVARQLYTLYSAGVLGPLDLDRVGFFKHYESESPESNERMNRLLEEIHALKPLLGDAPDLD